MLSPKISLIAAIGKNRELGKDNRLLFHIPEDMRRFKELTTGHVVIMGRKTFESIGKPLPHRINVIITHDQSYKPSSMVQTIKLLICHSLNDALTLAKEKERQEIFIIGGGQIYQQTIKYADKLYLTVVEKQFDADAFFPDYTNFKTVIFKKQGHCNNLNYTFLELTK